ncbi:hypothetical protein GB931_02790 [Modestobacter sp. I12A-02628]|uniref:SIR2-like domain-containing protein n=1 Tax=Goekera deserti TaxID=2497753 RepID=A0A7K3WFB5_9ACTN|nr:SIR2 family protein [Goekera deserti]MPQ96864.1 hypothetical protein [Goekera deserti]NDI46822.1 hypothetical protein [Goekera deserti]NEL54390.1 hypothetical protein [Goekera deserti]
MPLLAGLSDQVLRELNLPAETLTAFAGNLEEWLSFLSTDQPWLTDQQNLRNRAQFRDASEAVHACITQCEEAAVLSAPPPWLERLAWHWCAASPDIATYNYDLLLERLTTQLALTSTWGDLYGISLTERQAPGDSSFLSASRPVSSTYRLFKLHGSINWFYGGPDAPTTERVVLARDSVRWLGSPADSTEAVDRGRRAAVHEDLLPLIVPPTGTKGVSYGNRSLRAQWQKAFEALSSAESLTIIGYSFPPSDLVARHFLSSSLLAVPVAVVDRGELAAEVVADLLPRSDVQSVTGDDAVAHYVESVCGDVILWGVRHHERGRRACLRVNGVETELADDERFDASRYPGDSDPASTWAREEAERRYPGIANLALTNHWPSTGDSTLWQGVYTGPR